jgi:glutamate racemase
MVYLGDTARLPYGDKSPETIIQFCLNNADFLLQKQIKLLIIACNTACSHALEILQKKLPIPVFGVIDPGFQLLVKSTKSKRVAILGTVSTIQSGVYQKLIQQYDPAIQVFPIACPLFVPLIEEGYLNHQATQLIAQEYLSDLNVDAALLACTHYPLIKEILHNVLGSEVALIEPASTLAGQIQNFLLMHSLQNDQIIKPTYEFYASDNPDKFRRLGKLFFQQGLEKVLST